RVRADRPRGVPDLHGLTPWRGAPRAPVRSFRRKAAGRETKSESDAADEDVAVHDPVAQEAVPRMPEGGRLVVLEEEVADPGEAVAGERHAQQPPGIAQ